MKYQILCRKFDVFTVTAHFRLPDEIPKMLCKMLFSFTRTKTASMLKIHEFLDFLRAEVLWGNLN